MGVAPLAGWGVNSLRRMGTGLMVPLLLTAATLGLFAMLGHRDTLTLVGYAVVALAGWVAVYETARAVRARQQHLKESPLVALLALVRRNPRRYGGYMVHVGVVVIGIGIIASTLYQQETQATLAIGEEMTLDAIRCVTASLTEAKLPKMDASWILPWLRSSALVNEWPRCDHAATSSHSRQI